MKKVISLITAVVFVAIIAVSCAEGSASYNITDVMQTIDAAVKIDTPREVPLDDFLMETGIAAEDVEEFTGKVTNINGGAGIIYIVKAAPGKAGDIKTVLEGVRDGTADFLGNYPEFETAQEITKAGRCVIKGDYVALVIGCDAASAEADGVDKAYEAVDKAIDEAFK